MPRSRFSRPRSSPLNTTYQRQREQVIEKADTLLSTKGRLSAAVYLSQNLGETLLHELFKGFEPSPIPSQDRVDFLTVAGTTKAAIKSLTDLATVMASLEGILAEPHSKFEAAPFVKVVTEILLERWSEISRWIDFFVHLVPHSVDPTAWEKLMMGCLQVVDPIFVHSGHNPCMGQIASLPSTIDLVVGFLCLRDPSNGRPYRVPGIASTCAVCTLFASAGVISEIGSATLSPFLTLLGARSKSRLLESILQRIQDAVPAPKTLATVGAATRDLAHLTYALPAFPLLELRRKFGQGSILSEATRVIAEISKSAIQMEIKDKEVWFSIGESIGNLIRLSRPGSGKTDRSIEVLLEAGIIPPLLLSLSSCMDPSFPRRLDDPAQDLLYWLLDSRLFSAAQKGGLRQSLFQDPRLKESQSNVRGGKLVKNIHTAFEFALHFCEAAFTPGRMVPARMCCALKHSKPTQRCEDISSLKTCGRCKLAVYCSKACQREDWPEFHSKECLQAAHARKQLKEAGISVRYRRDKLMLLVAVVNKLLPDLRSFRQEQQLQLLQGVSPAGTDIGSQILSFDFTGAMLRLANSLTSYINDNLTHFFKMRTIGPDSQERVLKCAREVKFDPNSLLLVAGTFIDSRTITTFCVKMQYCGNAAEDERYKVVSTVCSVTLRSSLPPRNEAGGKLWDELGRR